VVIKKYQQMPEAVHAKSFSHVQNQESDIRWLSLHPMAQQAAPCANCLAALKPALTWAIDIVAGTSMST